ncbi:hypothetical protein Taro_046454 [Colocasia esculenta]|uniref:Uncharacterized protein n=1 Tax=Colocasia esculenta TaxID=4460 RepID=A0A843X7E8_COLES|nr:hypothetical protein [Colocasia esculenta]
MVRGGQSGRVSISVGRGSTRIGTASPFTPVIPATDIWTASPSTPVVPTTGTASPSTPVIPATGTASPALPIASPFPSQSPPEVESHHPAADEEGPQLPGRQPCWISGGKIDSGSASRYITTLRRYVFTRPEDLPRARVVWESTAQTNLRKSMWEARDKATKTTCSQDLKAWMDYGPVWLRRDY